ncbi:dienelactone hydrolase family protein [Salinisphaera sp. T31B1]|uniref:dienelactone hydrolase family protein n=1 Tax=Salinisphaera sp. T31B1 TaxID=727963 RepID=UPI0033428616
MYRFAFCLFVLIALTSALPASAAIHTEAVDYSVDGVPHIGYLAYDDASQDPRPGVLVVPEWWGLNDYAKQRARQLAEAGYVAFAADMYGNRRTTDQPDEAARWSQAAKPQLRNLGRAALDVLAARAQVDADHLGAIGFCFGGTSVLELAYSGAPLDAVVSLHGHLPPPGDDDTPGAAILVLHGAADPMVPLADVSRFAQALNARPGLDWRLTMYGHAEHAFTNPAADAYGIEGVAYDETAARRAWAATQGFLDDTLRAAPTD